MTLYEKLEEAVLWGIEDYKTDLTKIDRECLEKHQGVPFLHIARKAGSHLIFLPPAEQYPLLGEKVRYLFGFVGRIGLCEKKLKEFEAIFNTFRDQIFAIHWSDGERELRSLSEHEAREYVCAYVRRIKYKLGEAS